MRVANTVELKNRTNALLRLVMRGEPVIITLRGKPAASLTALSEDDLEDFVLEHSPKVRRLVARLPPLPSVLRRLPGHLSSIVSMAP